MEGIIVDLDSVISTYHAEMIDEYRDTEIDLPVRELIPYVFGGRYRLDQVRYAFVGYPDHGLLEDVFAELIVDVDRRVSEATGVAIDSLRYRFVQWVPPTAIYIVREELISSWQDI